MIVIKFGGTSLANVTLIRRAAILVRDRYLNKNLYPVVVVSAMAGVTDTLSQYLSEFAIKEAEQDVVLSSGEPITTALMAMAFQELGFQSRSFLGWQVPILTDKTVRHAKIIDIPTGNILSCLSQKIIPVIAGFQGISEDSRITTLGRGGSDTTAVAIAAALQAKQCDIYTDVQGVYTADPRVVLAARKLDHLSYLEVLELSCCGAKVLHSRSVECAMKYGIKLRILSSFSDGNGTQIDNSDKLNFTDLLQEDNVETPSITGIATQIKIVKFDLILGKDSLNQCALMNQLAVLKIPLDTIIQNPLESGNHVFSFCVDFENERELSDFCQHLKQESHIIDFFIDHELACLSIVGIGIRSLAGKIFGILHQNAINVLSFSIMPLSIRILINKPDAYLASLVLHSGLDLG